MYRNISLGGSILQTWIERQTDWEHVYSTKGYNGPMSGWLALPYGEQIILGALLPQSVLDSQVGLRLQLLPRKVRTAETIVN